MFSGYKVKPMQRPSSAKTKVGVTPYGKTTGQSIYWHERNESVMKSIDELDFDGEQPKGE